MWAKAKQTGFTIVELLIVIVVIAILAAIVIVAYSGITQRAQVAAVQSDLEQASKQLEIAKISSGTDVYPSDQASASLKSSANTTINYYYTSSTNSYCVENTTSGGVKYFITSASKTPTIGFCQGMVGWWPFDNSSVSDLSGSGNDGTISGATPAVSKNGQDSSAFSFNGTSNYISTNTTNFPLGSAARSVFFWATVTSIPASGWRMGDSYGQATTANASAFSIASTGVIAFNSQSNDFLSTTLSPPLNTWHLFGYTLTGTALTLWMDNQSQSATLASTPNTLANTHYIGKWSGGNNYWAGSIDDMRVYNRVLSSSEIASLYANGPQ